MLRTTCTLLCIILTCIFNPASLYAQCGTPPPTGSTTQTFCSGARVSDLSVSGTDIKWYGSDTGGTPYLSTDILRGTYSWGYHYYASQTVNGCESDTRLYVIVNIEINSTPAPSFPFTTTWKTVASNAKNNIALKTDGTLWTWGWNNAGQLGDGTTTDSSTPIQIGIGNKWDTVEAGHLCSFAIKKDGTLWAWGDNQFGQLGDGTTTSKNIPTKLGNAFNWKSISTTYSHVVALRTDGTLWTWGNNQKGQLGIGTNSNQLTPVQVGTATDWIAISAGLQHTLALKADGTLWAWGGNYYRQLGNGDNTLADKNIPVKIGTDTNWRSIHASSLSSFAIKTDGTLWGWGNNTWGQLGDGSIGDKAIPTKIGSDNQWLTISPTGADRFHNIAVKTDGTLWVWGYNKEGQLGNGINAETYTTTPFQIGSGTTWASVSVGDALSVAIKKDGSLWEWGNVDYSYTVIETGSYYLVPTLRIPPDGLALQTFCSTATVADLTATGTDVKWYTVPSGGVPISPSIALQNEMHYYATQKVNYCESESRLHAVALVGSAPTPAPTGSASQSFCQGATLADVTIQGADVKWYNSTTGGTPLPLSTLLISGYHYYASQTLNVCESSPRLDVLTTLTTIPPPTGSGAQTLCTGARIADLSAHGTAVKWYNADTGDTLLLPSTLLTSGSHYYASQTISGCESSRLNVLSTLANPPAPTGSGSQSFCEGATIADVSVQGVTVKWYSTNTGGSALASSTLLNSGSHYYASQTVSGCESSSRLNVLITLKTTNAPTGESRQTMERGKRISDLMVTGTEIKWYQNKNDAANRINRLDINTPLVAGTTYYATQTVSGCESASAFGVEVIMVMALEFSPEILEFYPNPVKDILNITVAQPVDRIIIFNSLGQQMHASKIDDQKAQLDLSTFGNGVYFIQMWSGNKVTQLKVVKH